MLLRKSGGFEARDPWVIYHEGYFYHCYSKGAKRLYVKKSATAEGLTDADEVCVYVPEEGKPYSCELWAPELHIIGGKCYIYVACDDGDNYNHRMYVLENGTSDPTAVYHMAGKIGDKTDKWAIDATILQRDGELYMIWSGWEGDVNVCQNLYIAKMSDPYTISSERVMISKPEYDWEKMDCNGTTHPFINEGPCVYQKDGELYIIYSASGSWANHYCLGILKHVSTDLLDPAGWEKQEFPALCIDDGYNGPGHCSVCFDGKYDYIAFHTYDEGKTKGWQNVHALIYPFKLENGKIIEVSDK